MPTLAVVLFALAALGGLFLAVRHFKGQSLPMPVSLIHGAAAATGLVLVILAYFGGGGAATSGLTLPLIILVVAALGGFFLFSFHLRGLRAPNAVVVIHALVAVVGFLALVLAVF